MNTLTLKLLAWGIALTLVALPIVGVLNGWFASERWPVRKIESRAEYNHVSAEQIRAAVQNHIGSGFFAVQLADVQKSVSTLPWVERVEARKQWPDTLQLTVYERQVYARWSETRLISRSGEIFSVPGAEGIQGLPHLSGPDDRLTDVLAFHADCLREFTGSGLSVRAVDLSARGGWRLTLASGALIEVGRIEPKARLQRFLNAWPQLALAAGGPPVYIDLRYENGFAVRWALPPTTGIADPQSGIRQFARVDALRQYPMPVATAFVESPIPIHQSLLPRSPAS